MFTILPTIYFLAFIYFLFIFRDLVYLYQFVDPGQVSMFRAHIALQELQAVVMMLHKMGFHLSDKMVALHLDNSTAKGLFL